MKRMVLLIAAAVSSSGAAQSLYEQDTSAPPARGADGAVATVPGDAPLQEVSLFAIEPPQPREFVQHDLVTIIISEKNKFERDQSLETEKDYLARMTLRQFFDLRELIENATLINGSDEAASIDLSGGFDFKGEGEYGREDTLTGRVTAQILEVKPNGNLVLEAKTSLITDEEEQHILLTGVCRTEDVTDANTVQSNQVFDLTLDVQNHGSVEKTSRKGLIPNILETIFNF